METPQAKTSWIEIVKNYLPALVLLGGGFVSLVLTWRDVHDNKKAVELLKEQVTRQYATQREMNDKTNKEVDELKLWMEYHKGYEQARKDYNLKP